MVLLGVVVFWCIFIGWSVMFAFADKSHASNVTGIVLLPAFFFAQSWVGLSLAVVFWCLVSFLALFGHVDRCRYTAVFLLVAHWLTAIFMLGRDLLSAGSVTSIARAFRDYPSLGVWLVSYLLTQYYICKRLVEAKEDAA